MTPRMRIVWDVLESAKDAGDIMVISAFCCVIAWSKFRTRFWRQCKMLSWFVAISAVAFGVSIYPTDVWPLITVIASSLGYAMASIPFCLMFRRNFVLDIERFERDLAAAVADIREAGR